MTTLNPETPANQGAAGSAFALISLTSLFFMWGFITALNDILIPHLKSVFSLNYTQAMLIQLCFFGAYFLISVPAGRLVEKLGFQKGIAAGLLTAALGCLAFIPSAIYETYSMFLAALFILAAGITILQVAANPLVTLMGDPATSSSRLTMTQAFNSLGTTVAPIIGGYLIFSTTNEHSADSVILPYIALAVTLVLLALIFAKLQLPKPQLSHSSDDVNDQNSIWQHPHLLLGAVGIFVYVGAEVSIGSFLVNFLGEDYVMGFTESQAANYIAYYWGGAMIGRFIGALLMQKVPAGILLAVNSLASMLLILLAVVSQGETAMWSILAVGLCNSIMFPTIFSLALKDVGTVTSRGSGLLCLAIVGGALVPLVQGMLADTLGLQLSFLLPLLCYLYIAFYGIVGAKLRGAAIQVQTKVA